VWVAYVPIHDHRGNVVVLLDRATGAVAEYYRYDAFGNTQIYNPAHSLVPDSAVGNPWRFASKRADMETGFVYFGRRLYDPQAGRFISADPLGFLDGPNRYLFAQANPITMTDFDGLLARQLGQNFAGWGDANFNLVNGDWRYMPTMNYLDWSGWGDYFPAAIQNMLFAPIWNLAAGTVNPMIDVHIYGSDSEYAPYMFIMMHPEVAMQVEYTMQAMGPLVETTVGRVGQWIGGKQPTDPIVNAAKSEGAVFWSGRAGANRAAAEAFAEQSGRTTLEMSSAGRALEQQGVTFAQNPEAWINASREFAAQASGEVNAFVGGARANSIWKTVELPTLMQNNSVTKIIIQDATRPEVTRIIYPPRAR